ncbi:MAG: DUF1016 N-terminal domain-containing protein [Patescibacteria group bacterium]
MKKAIAKKAPYAVKRDAGGIATLVVEVRALIAAERHAAASTINTLQVLTNFEIGRRIVEHEQKGEKRAEYGAELIKVLSDRLTEEFGNGFSGRNLRNFRSFFLTYRERSSQIWQQPAAKLGAGQIVQQVTEKSLLTPISEQPVRKSPFILSWTHYVLLLTIKDADERSFYEIEATNQGWSVPELKRQLTLPKGANIHAREYQLYLPSKELLKKKLLEWTREAQTGADDEEIK